MDKLDKKALKILQTNIDDDLDTGDIAIALKCDDTSVRESLNSLKNKNLVESYSQSGKVYWRLFGEKPIKKAIDSEIFELEITRAKKENSEPEEFIIDRMSEELAKAAAKPATPEHVVVPLRKSTIDIEEFLVEPIKPKPVDASVNPFTREPAPQPKEISKKEPEEFIITTSAESEEPRDVDSDENIVDDKTRVWTLPLTKPMDHEAVPKDEKDEKHGGEVMELPEFPMPLNRSHSSIVGIIIAVLVSVSISTGITMFVSINASSAVASDIQTLKTMVTESNARHDQQIEMLFKKVNFLTEKNDILQKQRPAKIQ